MGRLFILFILAMLAVWLVKRTLAGPRERAGGAADPAAGELVRCAHCGVNLPRTEARSAGGRHYCSEEHWRLGPRDG